MKLKLLVFSPFYTPHIGGLESHADEFNKHLTKRGVNISIFTPRLPSSAPEEEIVHENVRIIRFPAWEPIHNYPVPKFWMPKFWNLLKEALSSKPEILISRTRFFSTSLLALLLSKIKHIPLIHIEHGSDYAIFNSPVKTLLGKWYDHTLGRLVLRYSDTLIANSAASATFVKKLSGKDCAIIYRGIEGDDICTIAPDKDFLNKKHGRLGIGFVGRLIDGKGVANLLAALSHIPRKKFVVACIGDGPERKKLERDTKKYSLEEEVLFFGHKKHPEAIALMKACDIIVNPSYTEGLPTSIIEAALCEKAIIATNVGGTPEIISGNGDGFLVPAGDINVLREKLGFLIEHPDIRAQFGRNALLIIQNKFNWDTSAEKYLHVFEKTLKKNSKK